MGADEIPSQEAPMREIPERGLAARLLRPAGGFVLLGLAALLLVGAGSSGPSQAKAACDLLFTGAFGNLLCPA